MARAPLGVRAVFKPQRPLRQFLVQVKEKTSPENQKEVVYDVPCKDCKLEYIGETKRSLKTRMTEHKYAVRRGDEQNGVACAQTLTQYWVGISQDADDNSRILSRRTLEAIQIQREHCTMDLDCGLHISPVWNPLLDTAGIDLTWPNCCISSWLIQFLLRMTSLHTFTPSMTSHHNYLHISSTFSPVFYQFQLTKAYTAKTSWFIWPCATCIAQEFPHLLRLIFIWLHHGSGRYSNQCNLHMGLYRLNVCPYTSCIDCCIGHSDNSCAGLIWLVVVVAVVACRCIPLQLAPMVVLACSYCWWCVFLYINWHKYSTCTCSGHYIVSMRIQMTLPMYNCYTAFLHFCRVVNMLQHDDSVDAPQGSQELKLKFSFINDFVDNPLMKVICTVACQHTGSSNSLILYRDPLLP